MTIKSNFSIIFAFAVTAIFVTPISAAADSADANKSATLEQETSQKSDLESLNRPNYRFFNVRLTGGPSFALRDDLDSKELGEYGGQGVIGVDWVLAGPLALSALIGYTSFSKGEAGALQDLFATFGFMLRLFPNKKGALGEKGGNPFGQFFLDAHFGYHNYEHQDKAGYNIGIGYEFSLAKDFNLGPYFRFAHVPVGDGFSYMSASFGIQVSVGGKFEPDDADSDGIEDAHDLCPLDPEDIDGYEDSDGCPELDNDSDGVLDIDDKCPNEYGVPYRKGCPETDNDHDGILNEDDKCPDDSEDKDKFEDEDGCPEPDNDRDGILDTEDKCPNEAEDFDGFEDEDGCPDLDNDKDGILDSNDRCPLIPETVNGFEDEDGCPDYVRLLDDRIELLQPVYLAKNNKTVLDSSKPMLEEAAALLKLKSGQSIKIEAHTDNKLSKADSLKISASRADAVKEFLVSLGIDQSRLYTQGMGRENPIEDNKTKEGQAKNNRIELLFVQSLPSSEVN